MEFWFSEMHTDNVKISVRVNRQLFGAQSDFQRIDVFDSPEFGLFLTSDGSIIFSEKDEFTYDEMIVHVPMAVHPNVRRVLVIGGGDGGVARELSYYDEIEAIDVVEPDKMFVDVCREFFPDNAKGLDDPRVTVYYQDGLRFLRAKQDAYDLIINDSTDPLGHTAGLFTKEFYGSCYKALHDDGIMVYQHGSPFYDEDEEPCRAMHRKAFRSFPISRVYQAHIPTCAAGYWLFGFASKKYHPLTDLDAARWNRRGIQTWYYTTNLHMGAFMLPKYVEDLLIEEENNGRKRKGCCIMSKLLVIGCGGVAAVAIHKCCENSGVFSELCIASRTKSKCDALKEKLEKTTSVKLTTAQVDADDVQQLVALIERYRPAAVLNVALPYQDLTIMEACLQTRTDYIDTANYEPENTDDPEWRRIYEQRCREKGFTAYFDYSWPGA